MNTEEKPTNTTKIQEMMRPARSRRVLAQRKFAQGAYVPPTAAPASSTNGDRRDNNPSGRNFIIQHNVGPSVFVDYISYQGLALHHKGLQPFVKVTRLEEVPTSRTTRRTELMRNRELVRNRELDKNRDIHDNQITNTQTNKNASRNKSIVTNKDKDKVSCCSKDIVKNKNNARKNNEGANKDIVKNNEISKNKSIDRTKDLGRNKEKLSNQLNREKSQPAKKPPALKPVHGMSLRSKRVKLNKKEASGSLATRLSAAKRRVAKSLEETAKQEKRRIGAPKTLKRRNLSSAGPSEFSLEDNRPLTYFAKSSTPNRPQAAPVPRVSLVPLTSATTITEPVAGPSEVNKRKVTRPRSPKTKSNPYVLLPDIASTPLPAQTPKQKKTEQNDAKKPSNKNNSLINTSDEHGLLKVQKTKPAPRTKVYEPCPALRWHTVKELHSADKAQLEARCLKCDVCQRINKFMKLSEALRAQGNIDISGFNDDNTAEEDSNASADRTIYMEMLPAMKNALMKVQTHNFLRKNILSTCLTPREHSKQTKNLSLVEQEILLKEVYAKLALSTEGVKCPSRQGIESCNESESSTNKSLPKPRPNIYTQRKRRQSVCADLAENTQIPDTDSVPEAETQPLPERPRRKSMCVDLAKKQQPARKNKDSVSAKKMESLRKRRQSVCADMAMKPIVPRESVSPEAVSLPLHQRQRRKSVCADLAKQHQALVPQRDSVSPEVVRKSVCADAAKGPRNSRVSFSPDAERQPLPRGRRQSVFVPMGAQSDEEDFPEKFDPASIQISTPVANYIQHDRQTEEVNENYVIDPAEKPVEAPLHHEQNMESSADEELTEQNMESEEELTDQKNEELRAGKMSPAPSGASSRSSVSLVFEDDASEARLMAEVDEQAKALENEKDAKGDFCPDVGQSSGTEASAEAALIVDAPVFHPTKEEFDDPIAYYEKILPIAFKYGICKVVPPEGWKPKSKINEEIRFDVTNQYISRLYCRWGPASRELSALKLCLQQQSANVNRPPLIDGVEVNLPKLYHLVHRHGGLENVINKKRWGKVAEEMKFNKTPVIERKLDQIYVKYLLPYATLDHNERQEIMKKVEVAWHHKNQKLLDRATNPLHRQKRMLGESESSDGETEDEGTANALADAEDCVVPGQCMNFAKFKKVATNAYENHIGSERPGGEPPSIEVIEDRYWRHVVTGTEHLCVNTAAIDTGEEGHGFTKNKNEYYGRHPWNLKMFSQNPGNILRYLGPVLGMTVPTLHLGMIFSTSCWHKDPHAFPWTEFMHKGTGRIWYGIPDDQSDNFRRAVETLSPTSCQNKCLWLPTDIAMIPPQILREHNVSLARTVQNPGEFILVFPKAYSCSISTGYTESESVYFAPRSWFKNLAQVIQETRESCEPTMFSLEQLLFLMCQDHDSEADLLNIVKPTLDKIVADEINYREQLVEKGVKVFVESETAATSSLKRNASAYNVRDQDECEYCRSTIYLSKVLGLTGKKSALCLEHALLLLNSNKYRDVDATELEMFVYKTSHELREVTATVEARLNPSPAPSPSP